MKRLTLAVLSALVLASPAFAIVGGPWDGNVPGNPTPVNPSNANGTFQGTISGKNIIGIMRVGTSSAGTAAVPGVTITTGTGAARTTVTTAGTATGSATIFIEGSTAIANVDAVIDLSGRKLSAVMDGASTRAPQIAVTNPTFTLVLTGTDKNGLPTLQTVTAPGSWVVTDNVSFSGAFDANLSKNWSANTFSGKGFVSVSRFDIAAYNADLVKNPTSARPEGHIASHDVKIKVTGSKTSNTSSITTITVPVGEPLVRQLAP